MAALDPVLRQRGGCWVSAEDAEEHQMAHADGPHAEYDLASVSIPRAEHDRYYFGVSNAVLWPLLHSFPPTIRVGRAPWSSYVAANRAFADVVIESTRSSDLIWVQDYQLMLVPQMVREKRPKNRIGWFCHVPWPSPDLFGILPTRSDILEGLLGADVLGFHTRTYADNFLACAERYTSSRVDHERGAVEFRGRRIKVFPAPIGIAFDEVQTISANPEILAEVDRIKASVGHRRIVLGVDRLDYTKGIPERILAYERFLKQERSARDRFVFVQVMVPSRTAVDAYAQLKSEVDRLVGSINGRYGATGRVPIHYLYRSLPQRDLYAHYRAADVALVTPLRDGMNLVAHEYCATRLEADGVLILSEFAGAAQYLRGAIEVNPYDIHAMSSAIQIALDMEAGETHKRMTALRASVMKLDVHRWAGGYLDALESVG